MLMIWLPPPWFAAAALRFYSKLARTS